MAVSMLSLQIHRIQVVCRLSVVLGVYGSSLRGSDLRESPPDVPNMVLPSNARHIATESRTMIISLCKFKELIS